MSASTVTLPTVRGAEWFKAPIGFARWPKFAQLAWSWLKRRNRMGRTDHRVTDREIGVEIERCRRTVQRGLKWLADAEIIRRIHDESGRIIRMVLPLAGDGQERKQGAVPTERARRRPAERSAPKPPPKPGSTPMVAQAPTVDESPEDPTAVAEALAQLRGQVAEQKAAREAERGRNRLAPELVGQDFEREARELTPEGFSRLEALERRGEITSTERRVLEVARRIRDS